jgi:competence ComEA-like helix-hairpin-helix protein
MSLWAPRELRLLLVLGAILLVGLSLGQWRSSFPALAERLEGFDEAPRPGPAGAAGRTAARSAPGGDRRRDPVARAGPALELNRASAAELATLPGIGPGLARRIVAERERRGVFESVDALRAVPGLGPKKLLHLRGLVTASPEARWSAEPGPDLPVEEPDAAGEP